MARGRDLFSPSIYRLRRARWRARSDHGRVRVTVTQFVTDLCPNELEDRGELVLVGDTPLVPYVADYRIETILTRDEPDQ
jgi:hypothetical protein